MNNEETQRKNRCDTKNTMCKKRPVKTCAMQHKAQRNTERNAKTSATLKTEYIEEAHPPTLATQEIKAPRKNKHHATESALQQKTMHRNKRAAQTKT